MIPAQQYNQSLANDLNWWLIQELRRTMSDRANLEADWLCWEQVYRARPLEPVKNFPFRGASNIVIAQMAADVETLFARMMGLLLEPQNLWSVTAHNPEMVDFAAATQEFLEWAQQNELDLQPVLADWIMELHKLGTGILKQRYTREMKKIYEWRELDTGTWQQQAVVMMKDRPALHHVRLHDFYVPAGFKDIQQAPWCAERVRMTWQQFMNRVKAGLYTNADKIGGWYYNPPINRVQQQLDRGSNYIASQNKLMEFYEFWLDYDIDGDGWDEALVCTIHLESQTYVRLDYNPFFNQEKPYSVGRFLRDVNSFYGIGMGEMLWMYQEQITTINNQRNDNNTIQNSQMFAVSKDNTNIKTDEPIWSGKVWKLNKPTDIVPLNMGTGQGIASSIEVEQAVRSEAQRRTGVNDYVQANATAAVGYGAAYTTQQMLAQSSKRFGETTREVRGALNESGTRILELYQQFNQRGKPFVLGQKDGSMVNAVLHFPLDLIRRGLRVGVTAIDVQQSKDAQIRTKTLVMQQLQQFYMGYLQAAQFAVNPNLPPLIKQGALTMMEGSSLMMRRLLELYGEQDADRMVPQLEDAVNAQNRELQQLQQLLALSGGAGVVGGPPQAPGMAPLHGAGPGPVGGGMSGQPPQIPQFAGNGSGAGGPGYAR